MMIHKHPDGDFWLNASHGISVSFDAYEIEERWGMLTLYKNGFSTAVIDVRNCNFSLLPNELRKIRVPSPFRARLIKHHKVTQAKIR
ncbi:hypothetical protein RJD39_12740 [Vibrio scophthalmi]|uniref:Uncharacterized protein n=1 Tax=Vibrio scophthalmi TaxID=45658 RepID=A0A1E3WJ68_9VIBR|nr:hypothetical protein [Vibrio scophthalmi]ODS09808.1 hypothetical protein VSF3289_00039 [Vibrio scophthalmi]